ncbi:putative IQ motif, EF-hand binding protein [Plasmopara halstedii]
MSDRLDQRVLLFAEDRCKTEKISSNTVMTTFKQKTDEFDAKMTTIRARLEASRKLVSSEHSCFLPAVATSPTHLSTRSKHSLSLDQLKLPLLRQISVKRRSDAFQKIQLTKVISSDISSVRDADALEQVDAYMTRRNQNQSGNPPTSTVASSFDDVERRCEEHTPRNMSRPESTAFSIDEEKVSDTEINSQFMVNLNTSSNVLPMEIAAIENDVHSFRSMQRIGSWLGMNEAKRNMPMLAIQSGCEDRFQVAGTAERLNVNDSSVMNKIFREVTDCDIANSRLECNASLCREWVLFARCSRKRADKSSNYASVHLKSNTGLGCLRRHFYISFEEKQQMIEWVQTKESRLERNILCVIIEREALIERVHRLCNECMAQYQQNMVAETGDMIMKLLTELSHVRFLTVKVLENIDQWRRYARKIGFARYDSQLNQEDMANVVSERAAYGWSVSITLDTEKRLYKSSKGFVSKTKRFCRSKVIFGKPEKQTIYLGYYDTKESAERAYDERAASEARRLNLTVKQIPCRRNVFRSCGKHFAVESEKGGSSFCIECMTKLSASSSPSMNDWKPPFFFGSNGNYIMKMAKDLDFLNDVIPLKKALNNGRGIDDEVFPVCGNVLLLHKIPNQDPDLATFTTFVTSSACQPKSSIPGMSNIGEEFQGRKRILKAQQLYLQELQIYQSGLSTDSANMNKIDQNLQKDKASEPSALQYRLVEALYWDHCAALKIPQERAPLAMRQQNIWCRPDAGEWSSLLIRGAHQRHFLFENKLEKAGNDLMQKRHALLRGLRRLRKVPLYLIQSRTSFIKLIAAGQKLRGDVLQLEINNVTKRLDQYDLWCKKALLVQRMIRGEIGRRKARATKAAFHLAHKLRVYYYKQVASLAKMFYESEIRTMAIRKAKKKICTPVYIRVVKMDGELAIVTFHSLRHFDFYYVNDHKAATNSHSIMSSSCCFTCARRFDVKCQYRAQDSKFEVGREVCTCFLNGGSNSKDVQNRESWLIRAYSPSHNNVYRLRLESTQLHRLLLSIKLNLHMSSTYHPLISNMETKLLKAAAASRYADFFSKKAKSAVKTLSNWRRIHSDAIDQRESLAAELKRSLTLLNSLNSFLAVSISDTKRALDYTYRSFSEAQAWDQLENANDRTSILQKRQLTKRIEECRQDVERLRYECFKATYNEQYIQARVLKSNDDYNLTWYPLMERYCQAAEKALFVSHSAKQRMESVMAHICQSCLTLRDCNIVPIRRNLILQNPTWNDMALPGINIPGLRNQLTYLRRRTIKLSSVATFAQKTWRVMITVSMSLIVNYDSRTKRDFWITAYDPVDCSEHKIFLEYELLQLVIGLSGRKLWYSSSRSKRSIWRATADILISIAMLDRFTGEFTLHKLTFFHMLRELTPRFLSSKVMQDLQKGRKCGQGDIVLRQAAVVDKKNCMVVVYENWGDLTFAIYHTSSGDSYRLSVPLSQVFDLLSQKPLMLRLWICCVKSNSYSSLTLLYILKHVRFFQRDSGREDVQIELLAQENITVYQKVRQIQKRKVLVSILEDRAGDFQINVYDMSSELTYKLSMERESLHRILKTCDVPTFSEFQSRNKLATSSSALLLSRNRELLFKWMCSRLRFRNIAEHPSWISSESSSLLSGLHLRESFQILNRWIATSSRNPIQAVSEADITRRALAIDANAFSSLLFDQLTMIANPHLPFELDKQYVGTMDWIEAVAASSSTSQAWKKELPFMRVDFFVGAHKLFVRLRKELELETKERKRRETWADMEQEDHDALILDISRLMDKSNALLTRMRHKLLDLRTAATNKIEQWNFVHLQIRKNIYSADMEISTDVVSPFFESVRMFREDNNSVFLNLVNRWVPTPSTDLHTFISLASLDHLWYSTKAAASLLQACLKKIDLDFIPTLCKFESRFNKISYRDRCLEKLWKHRRQILQLFGSPNRPSSVSTAPIETNGDATMNNEADDQTMHLDNQIPPARTTTSNMINTGLLIPSNISEPIIEIFLTEMPLWAPSESFSYEVYAQTLVDKLSPVFNQQWRQQNCCSRFGPTLSDETCHLTCKRLPYGILVCEKVDCEVLSRDEMTQYNPRGAALTGNYTICGLAFFWPLQMHCGWNQRILDCSHFLTGLVTSSKMFAPQKNSLEQRNKVRSAKYLPWKQFAIKKLRISQAVKRNRTHEVMCIDSLNYEDEMVEKDKRTVTIFTIEFQQLQIYLGEFTIENFRSGTNVTKWMKHFFSMRQELIRNGSKHEKNWRIMKSDMQVNSNVLDLCDSYGNAIRIPCSQNDGFISGNHLGKQ